MLGNFSYRNATTLYFGDDSLKYLNEELPKYGKNVQLIYGGGSVKKNGIYDAVIEILKSNGKNVIEDAGVMPNPTVEKLREGVKLAKENQVDLLLALGGGSCCDYAKAVSVSVCCDEDPWEKYFIRFEEPTCEIVPVGCILTMAGTGSEMNAGSVITNHETHQKIGHVFGEAVMPKFSILNPKFTMSLPKRQMVAGIYDIFNHICEQYFSDGNSGSRSVEIYRGYEDEDCVTFESMVKDKDTETWTSADCATFSKKDGHRLSVAEIFKCDEQQIKSLMWRYKGNLQTGVQKPEELVIGNAGYIDGWVIVIGPADHCLGAEYRLRYPEIEPYLRLGKNGRYYSDR